MEPMYNPSRISPTPFIVVLNSAFPSEKAWSRSLLSLERILDLAYSTTTVSCSNNKAPEELAFGGC